MNFTLFVVYSLLSLSLIIVVGYLVYAHHKILLGLTIIFTLAIVISFSVNSNFSLNEWMGLSKKIALIPLGLAVVYGFSLLNSSLREANIKLFSIIMNVSMLGNILMMMFIPPDGSYRNIVGKITCTLLVIWVLQEMKKRDWQTVKFEDGFFLFNASPLPWIFSHSLYRMILVSLPIFDSFKYVLLEPLSLSFMYIFYRAHQRKFAVYYYFGMAESVVVPTLAVTGWFLDLPVFNFLETSNFVLFSNFQLDLAFIPVQVLVCCFALYSISRNYRQVLVKSSRLN